jgi:acyl-CoA synthetase (NDP forming)
VAAREDGTGEIDLALIVVPVDAVAGAVDDCVAAGVRVAIVGTSGFGETGPDGQAAQAALAEKARAGGIRLVGPNCIGAANLLTGQIASFSPLFGGLMPRSYPFDGAAAERSPGGIGFASASGALGYGTVSLAVEQGLPLRWAVTTGNEADVTTLEVLARLAARPGCATVLGYLEGLADAAGLRALAATGTPAALLVAGASAGGARAVASHTGALATPDRVVDGALRQLGIVRVSDVDELLDVGEGLALTADSGRWPAGSRVAILTTSGGSGILAADAIEATGLTLAELSSSTVETLAGIVPSYGSVANPVDVTATVMRDRTLVDRCLTSLLADPGVDIILACFCVLVGDDVDAIVTSLGEAARSSGKPVLVARTGAAFLAPAAGDALRSAHLPSYVTPARTVRVTAALWQVAQARTKPRPSLGEATVAPRATPPLPGITEPELKAVLREAGIPVPGVSRVESTVDAAAAAVAELAATPERRAVLKVVAPDLVHKTEIGGVALDVSAENVHEVAARLLALPGAAGVLVEQQVPAGVEILVGVAPSPLGPALTIGAGGVLTEVLEDVALRLLPLTEDDVRDMLTETRVARLLGGFRGTPPADVDALVDLVLRVADLVAGWPEGASLDLNPVSVGPTGAVVLDAAYTLDGPSGKD